jgi:hypothetical protein
VTTEPLGLNLEITLRGELVRLRTARTVARKRLLARVDPDVFGEVIRNSSTEAAPIVMALERLLARMNARVLLEVRRVSA